MEPVSVILVVSVVSVLLVCHGTHGSRSHPNFFAPLNNTKSVPRLIGQASTSQDSGAAVSYFAYHGSADASDGYYGFIGTMDVYGFALTKGQGSAAAVWISDEGDGSVSNLKTIMIGWDVLPAEYGDSHTHFYTKWTNDGYMSTGCLNMNCLGFQPEKGATIAPGDVIEQTSFPKGEIKRKLNLKIIKDGTSGDWLVHCGLDRDPELIGRFPRSLFTGTFADRAVGITFGGVVIAPITKPTPMGSGYLPTDIRSAASISNIKLVDQNGRASSVDGDLPKFETNSDVYAVSPIVNGEFFYGGYNQPVV